MTNHRVVKYVPLIKGDCRSQKRKLLVHSNLNHLGRFDKLLLNYYNTISLCFEILLKVMTIKAPSSYNCFINLGKIRKQYRRAIL